MIYFFRPNIKALSYRRKSSTLDPNSMSLPSHFLDVLAVRSKLVKGNGLARNLRCRIHLDELLAENLFLRS